MSPIWWRARWISLMASVMNFAPGVVMPNHVHCVVWPMPGYTLSSILHSWKSFTSKQANQLLRREPTTFWQGESFDHCIADDAEQARLVAYAHNNPVKAGFCKQPEDWKWSSAFGRVPD